MSAITSSIILLLSSRAEIPCESAFTSLALMKVGDHSAQHDHQAYENTPKRSEDLSERVVDAASNASFINAIFTLSDAVCKTSNPDILWSLAAVESAFQFEYVDLQTRPVPLVGKHAVKFTDLMNQQPEKSAHLKVDIGPFGIPWMNAGRYGQKRPAAFFDGYESILFLASSFVKDKFSSCSDPSWAKCYYRVFKPEQETWMMKQFSQTQQDLFTWTSELIHNGEKRLVMGAGANSDRPSMILIPKTKLVNLFGDKAADGVSQKDLQKLAVNKNVAKINPVEVAAAKTPSTPVTAPEPYNATAEYAEEPLNNGNQNSISSNAEPEVAQDKNAMMEGFRTKDGFKDVTPSASVENEKANQAEKMSFREEATMINNSSDVPYYFEDPATPIGAKSDANPMLKYLPWEQLAKIVHSKDGQAASNKDASKNQWPMSNVLKEAESQRKTKSKCRICEKSDPDCSKGREGKPLYVSMFSTYLCITDDSNYVLRKWQSIQSKED
jgi:hypothetical protein